MGRPPKFWSVGDIIFVIGCAVYIGLHGVLTGFLLTHTSLEFWKVVLLLSGVVFAECGALWGIERFLRLFDEPDPFGTKQWHFCFRLIKWVASFSSKENREDLDFVLVDLRKDLREWMKEGRAPIVINSLLFLQVFRTCAALVVARGRRLLLNLLSLNE